LLLEDMRQAIDYLGKHSTRGALTADEASGFHH
jgi:hypothetical protein